MADVEIPNAEEILTDIDISFENVANEDVILKDFTIEKVLLGESLLTPGLQTSVMAHSYRHNFPTKNFDTLKNAQINITLEKKSLSKFNMPTILNVSQTIYRLENRFPVNINVEELTLRACDNSMILDTISLVSKSWKCASPSDVVSYVLQSCAGAKNPQVEPSGPPRDYIAENIHPFQVVAQQAKVALADNDPSFLHYMTYENMGTHHFKSLKSLTNKTAIREYYDSELGLHAGMSKPQTLLSYSFPCDFDLLSDLLNGVGLNGQDINSLIVFNPRNKSFSLVGDQTIGCGIGQGVVKMAQTNMGSAKDQNSCNTNVEKYLLKRQARMSLLERDKIALRITVPFDPSLHVGEIIKIHLRNKEAVASGKSTSENYGSGEYLILHMFHEVLRGGYSITTMDCVSKTVGVGVV